MTASWGGPNSSQGLSSFTRSRAFSMQRSSPCSRARRSAAIWVRSSSMSKLLSPVTRRWKLSLQMGGGNSIIWLIIIGLSRLYIDEVTQFTYVYMKDLYDHMPKGECDLGSVRWPVGLSVRFMQIPRSNKGFNTASRRIPFSCSGSINNEYGFMQRCQLINPAQRRCLTALNYKKK